MDVNKSEVAEFLITVKSKSASYSKQDMKSVFVKLYTIICDIDDLSSPRYQQYESRSVSAQQLDQICQMLESYGSRKLDVRTEQRLLTSVLEVTIGNLMELTNKKIESIMDVFIQYFYKGGIENTKESVLSSDFILEKLEKCFDLKVIRRTV